ncbi:HDOD domain-containing protein [Marinobacter sp. F4216]|uniref:HDOD domain-containing protein n=1 Tax=Marinobacter sp. F4216 TaxID=2874281 RepID=UPI001CBFAADA|nr:HDOD domain-containing protein [Marinobacter sp. F4216]MBZ2167333.1 HDOD domain-containing protein [Marinobacter sp. F4216]
MDLAPDLQLPSLPEIILRVLDACRQNDTPRSISDLASMDTALVARVLSLANSSSPKPESITSIDEALIRLGSERFRSLVLTAALQQLPLDLGYEEWLQLRDFWRHSLSTALTARALATLTRYPSPDQAFMLGILHNVGELLAIKTPTPEDKQYYFNNLTLIAAKLATDWGLGIVPADAMRYQQALPDELRDAGHLVKIISVATRLALSDAAGIKAAKTVFGLTEELIKELNRRIAHEVATAATGFGITLDGDYHGERAARQLQQTVLQESMASQALQRSDLTASMDNILADTVNSLSMVTGRPALCFRHRGENLDLLAGTLGSLPELSVSCRPGGSVLTEAFNTGSATQLGDRQPTVLDRQILSILRTPALIAVPLHTGTVCPGVYLLGTDRQNLDATTELASLFTNLLSTRLHEHSDHLLESKDRPDSPELNQELIRKQVHEINNPLTIVRQYLHQLSRQAQSGEILENLAVIKEELDRAGLLIDQLGHPAQQSLPERTQIELNDELKNLHRILGDTLFDDDKHQFEVQLCEYPSRLAADASAIRQVVINLVRNAAESLPEEGGKVEVRTASPIWHDYRTWVELEISDTGTGIPIDVRETLFKPVQSTKGEGHSGLGLNIVKKIIDDMDGIIACRTGLEGTTFRILLPTVSEQTSLVEDVETTETAQWHLNSQPTNPMVN